MSDLISRQAAIDALWGALFSYEEKEEERFQKSGELDVYDWFAHRIFVQNMSDIDRQVIRELPSANDALEDAYAHGYTYAESKFREMLDAQPEIIRCKDCKNWDTTWQNDWAKNYHYCPLIDGTRNGDWYCADAERREE